MKLTAQVKLLPSKDDAVSLKETLRLANEACNWISGRAWAEQVFGQFAIHNLAYHAARKQFPRLGSCILVRCIKKVADAYQLDKKTPRSFNPTGSIDLDHNLIRWYPKSKTISLWTVDGRKKISYVCGERQDKLLQTQQGQPDLATFGGQYFLLAPCNIEEPTPDQVTDVLGIDLGIANLAVTSDGKTFNGEAVQKVRECYTKIRKALQKKGSKSAKRHLINISRKESRFKKNQNHVISKQIVLDAKGTNRAIALEELKGIRSRTTVAKRHRDRHAKWAFSQLGQSIEYKAAVNGVPVVRVDPRYTSQGCPECGCITRKNRPVRDIFSCVQCHYSSPADHVSALNIRIKGLQSMSLSQSTLNLSNLNLLELQAALL